MLHDCARPEIPWRVFYEEGVMKMAAKSAGFSRGHKEAAGAYGLDKAASVKIRKLNRGIASGTGRQPGSSHNSSHKGNSGY